MSFFLISAWAEPASEEALWMRGCGEQDAVLARSHQGHDKMRGFWNAAQRVPLVCFPDSLFLNQSIVDMLLLSPSFPQFICIFLFS